MKKTLNKFLKFLGFNVVKATRARARKLAPLQLALLNESARARKEKNAAVLKKFFPDRPPYTEAELLNSGKIPPFGVGKIENTYQTEGHKLLKTHYVGDDRPPYTDAELLNSGKTHYVGDDCPGGHADCDPHVAVGYQAGTLPAQPDNTAVGTHNIAFGKESFAEVTPASPNNDNDVTGPIS